MQAIATDAAPAAIGAYAQAVAHGGFAFISGQLPLDPATGELTAGGMPRQLAQVFANLEAIAEAAGGSLARAVKLTVYLTDLADFAAVNEAMAQVFTGGFPARAAVQVAALPKGAAVEIDAIIALPD